ncbi:MAG: DUF348 domain-containing protein [Firmicutes bacterium]|nr:DUF348 domain-containing protein [Bacillota bacterium]
MGLVPAARPQKRRLWPYLIAAVVLLGLGVYLTAAKTVTIIVDNEVQQVVTTWTGSVDDVLAKAGVALLPEDRVEPAVNERVTRGMEIRITRSFPVTLVVGGSEKTARFIGGSVKDLLEQQGVELGEMDRVIPDLTQEVASSQTVEVIRVTVEQITVEEDLPYASREWAEPTLEKGKTKVVQQGQLGVQEKVYEVTCENGREVNRELLLTRVVREPKDEIIGIGTREPSKSVITTSRGPIQYKEVKEMVATAYYPGPESTGKWADGITATGVKAGYGIAAVDPKVIPLGSRLYVPGYGHALAADVGGAIKGNRIDLCFDTYNEAIQYGRRTVKVYILE